jgi:hypothetical protein
MAASTETGHGLSPVGEEIEDALSLWPQVAEPDIAMADADPF